MAVAYDAVGPSGGGGTYQTGATSITWSHTCSGSNRLLVVGLTVVLASTTNTMTVTYAGTAMTLLTQIAPLADGITYDRIYYLVAPAIGANNVVVTTSAAYQAITAGSVSFTGAATAPFGTPGTYFANGFTTSTVTLTGTQAGSICIDLWGYGGLGTPTGNQTLRWANNEAASFWGQGCATQQTAPGGGSVAMTHTAGAGGGADYVGQIAVEVLALAIAGTASLTAAAALAVAAVRVQLASATRTTTSTISATGTIGSQSTYGYGYTTGGYDGATTATSALATTSTISAAVTHIAPATASLSSAAALAAAYSAFGTATFVATSTRTISGLGIALGIEHLLAGATLSALATDVALGSTGPVSY